MFTKFFKSFLMLAARILTLTAEFIQRRLHLRPSSMLDVFGPNGYFSKCEKFEFRQPQADISQEVFQALSQEHHLLAQAGTGTGKTLAYLAAAVTHALNTRKAVVIATGTRQLQDQIAEHDIPFLLKWMPFKFKAEVLKGVNNYACLQRVRKAAKFNSKLSNLEAALKTARSGDWTELGENVPAQNNLSVNRSNCKNCELRSACPFIRHLDNVQKADIVITNHHNWLAQIKNSNSLTLPAHDAVIFDEAHLLENITINIYSEEFSTETFMFLFKALQNPSLSFVHTDILSIEDSARRFYAIKKADANPQAAILIEAGIIESTLLKVINKVVEQNDRAHKSFLSQLYFLKERLAVVLDRNEDDNFVLTFNIDENSKHFSIRAIPVEAHKYLRPIFEQKKSAIFVSATLSINKSFDYTRYFLGLAKDKTVEFETGSPFDYNSQAALYLPSLSDPRRKEFFPQAVAEIVKLTEISEGRAFVLCTSKHNAEALCKAVKDKVQFPCLLQGEGNLSTNELVDKFKATPHAILFGTATFWQGVDVQGAQLSCVIIDKLPFAVPTDPAFIARAKKLEAKNINPFFSYSLPQAVVQLNQGVGRLIRSVKDSGVVAILDPRASQSKYADYVLNNLPGFTRTTELDKLESFIKERQLLTQTKSFARDSFAANQETAAVQVSAMTVDKQGNVIF